MTDFDVIVVGAGPAGSAAALTSARAGLSTCLLERGEYAGAKNMFGGVFYGRILGEAIPDWWERAPIERIVTRRVTGFLSADALLAVDLRSAALATPPYNGVTLYRPRFDAWLAAEAEAAGAVLVTSTVVDGLLRDAAGGVAGVRARGADGELTAPLVIAADGVNSFLAKEAGLVGPTQAAHTAVAVKETIRLDRDVLEARFGLEGDDGVDYELVGAVTKGVAGGAFLYTYTDALAVGVVAHIASLAAHRERPQDLLDSFLAHPAIAPLVRGGERVEYSAHMIPEGGYDHLARFAAPGLLVAGDAAGLCFAAGLYLEGMNYAIASGVAAAETAVEAHRAGKFGLGVLAGYERRLRESFVLRDFEAYRRAGAFVLSERMQTVYPNVLCRIAEHVYRVDNPAPKRKLAAIAKAELRRAGVPRRRALADAVRAARIFGW